MKRFVAMLLILLLMLLGTACRKQTDSDETTAAVAVSAETTSASETGLDEQNAPTTAFSETTTIQETTAVPANSQASSTTAAETTPSTAAVSGIITEELTCYNGSLKIYGKMVRPASASALPCVILSHSSSMTHESMKSYSAFFAEQGYAAYAFDFCGGSQKSKSDGNPNDMTIFTEVSDLEAVLKTMQSLSYIDKNRIYLFGTSQGGLVSALAANEHPSEIKGLILLYPGFSIPEQVNTFASGGKLASALSSLYGQSGQAYLDTLIGYDAYEHIANFTGPVLIIHGTADFIVPIKYSEKAVATYQNAQLKVIQGASHGFNAENYSYKDYDAEVQQYILAYLNQ